MRTRITRNWNENSIKLTMVWEFLPSLYCILNEASFTCWSLQNRTTKRFLDWPKRTAHPYLSNYQPSTITISPHNQSSQCDREVSSRQIFIVSITLSYHQCLACECLWILTVSCGPNHQSIPHIQSSWFTMFSEDNSRNGAHLRQDWRFAGEQVHKGEESECEDRVQGGKCGWVGVLFIIWV